MRYKNGPQSQVFFFSVVLVFSPCQHKNSLTFLLMRSTVFLSLILEQNGGGKHTCHRRL